jgi:hypothetical protein
MHGFMNVKFTSAALQSQRKLENQLKASKLKETKLQRRRNKSKITKNCRKKESSEKNTNA